MTDALTDNRAAIIRDLRGLIDLDRGFGVEFIARPAPAAPTAIAVPSTLPRRLAEPTAFETLSASPTPPSLTLPAADPARTDDTLAVIAAEVAACRACGLCATRKNTVPGEGHAQPELLFVGEDPGAEEDVQGRPFVGAAGQLLTKMIQAMGLTREQVFLTNVLKCRPPDNRTPAPEEIGACLGYLHRQIAVLRPKLICTLGNTPLRALLRDDTLGITKLRGQKLIYRSGFGASERVIPLIPTFHPSYLLRNESAKKPCWDDLKLVLRELGRTAPVRSA